MESMPHREQDLRVTLFTEKHGKIQARARSARKITSKLSPHLQPGFFAKVRLVEKSGVQAVDALKTQKSVFGLPDLMELANLLPAFHAEPELWQTLRAGELRWPKVLRILGWDPVHARCGMCEGEADFFLTKSQEFLCGNCSSQLPRNQLLYVK